MDLSKKYKLGSERPISVSEYIVFLNEVLKKIRARVVGEVSELQFAASGHVYFSLRDKDDGSVLRCVIWKSIYGMCGVRLKEGMEIIISGYADIYSPRGSLAFKAETIELVGEGALKKAYDQLKEKLDKEGLFKEERKRPIPPFPRRIGVITSLHSGTVIHDFIGNLGKFGFKVKAIDSRVEGQEAVRDLLSAIRAFRRRNIDVLVIIRGGGSLQSLMAFDNENLVRAIVDFPVPIIAGIGHHKDITLAALAADACQSTPTAAANLLNKPWEDARHAVQRSEKAIMGEYRHLLSGQRELFGELTAKIIRIFDSIFESYREIENSFKKSIFQMEYSISGKKLKIKELSKAITGRFELAIRDKKIAVREIEKIIKLNNPRKWLKMGYSIAKHRGKVLKSINQVKVGDSVEIEVSDGIIDSEVRNKK